MQQFINTWNNLDTRKQMIVAGATLIVVVGVFLLSRMAAQPNYALLYSGLSQRASGEVIAALDAQGVRYDVRNSAIYVESSRRDALRLTLAAEGLPESDVNGYELLDGLTGFGTTSQMFDAAYIRAKEGELARTILANPQIVAARVHIAHNNSSPFRQASEATASVSLRGSGAGVSKDAAEAIRFLVASAVSGLTPENVSIIDAIKGTVLLQDESATPHQLGLDRAAVLKRNVERLIEARTGIGKAVVEVNVETLTDDEVIMERKFDPDGRVVVSTQTQETTNSAQNAAGGSVSVASNLPDGEAAGSDESQSQGAETQETINYELSETTRELRKTPGSIKRVSVAVLVDGVSQTSENGDLVWEPRPNDELAMLEELVKSAIGYDESRGDSVTIRSMELPNSIEVTSELTQTNWISSQNIDVVKLAQLAVTAVVVLILGLFVLRPILLGAMRKSEAGQSRELDLSFQPSESVLDGEVQSPEALGPRGIISANEGFNDPAPGFAQIPMSDRSQDPVERLKALIDERQEETVEILRGWIETPEGTN